MPLALLTLRSLLFAGSVPAGLMRVAADDGAADATGLHLVLCTSEGLREVWLASDGSLGMLEGYWSAFPTSTVLSSDALERTLLLIAGAAGVFLPLVGLTLIGLALVEATLYLTRRRALQAAS